MKLYELASEIHAINEELEANGGELLPLMEERLSALTLGVEQKAEAICALVLNDEDDLTIIEGQMKAAKQRYEEIQAKYRSIENKITRLKAYLKGCLEAAGIKELKGSTHPFRVWIQKNGGKLPVEITNEASVPARFIDIIPATTEINKDRIREAKLAGEDVSAFAKVEAGTHLKIR